MNIAHSETTPWQPTPSLRGGIIRFKTLLAGREGSPNNFSLVLADTDVSFKSPRHRHNFDQLRVTLEGSTNYGPRQNPRYVTGTIITQALEREHIELGALDPLRDFCFCTDNPAFNGRYLQAEHEVALENDLIGFSGLVRCQHNAFKHAF